MEFVRFTCSAGAVDDAHALCTKCDVGYARSLGTCQPCGHPGAFYLLVSLVFVVVAFPLLRSSIRHLTPSLYVSLGFLQFLGLYSSLGVHWSAQLRALLESLSLFNLRLDTVRFACVDGANGGLSFFDGWLVQMALPLLYVAAAFVEVILRYFLSLFALHYRPLASFLLRRFGWLPHRKHLNPKYLVDDYVAPACFYFNLYYYTGFSGTISMLRCSTDGRDGYYLLADPAIQCWKGEHLLRAKLAGAFALLYLLWPLFISWVLLVRLPKKGFKDPRTNRLFGFIHQRFTKEAWYWELVEVARKVFLVLVIKWDDGLAVSMRDDDRIIMAIIGISLILVASTLVRPYRVSLYDLLQTVANCAELSVLVFSLSSGYVQAFIGLGTAVTAGSSSSRHSAGWVETFAWVVILAALALCVASLLLDLRFLYTRARRVRALRKSTSCVLNPSLFDFDVFGGLVGAYLSARQRDGNVKALTRFRKMELLLLAKISQADDKAKIGNGSSQAEEFRRFARTYPAALDWLLSAGDEGAARHPASTPEDSSSGARSESSATSTAVPASGAWAVGSTSALMLGICKRLQDSAVRSDAARRDSNGRVDPMGRRDSYGRRRSWGAGGGFSLGRRRSSVSKEEDTLPSLLLFQEGICGPLLQWAASGEVSAEERARMREVLDDIRAFEPRWSQHIRRDTPRRLLAELELLRAPKEVAQRELRWLSKERRAHLKKSRYVRLRQGSILSLGRRSSEERRRSSASPHSQRGGSARGGEHMSQADLARLAAEAHEAELDGSMARRLMRWMSRSHAAAPESGAPRVSSVRSVSVLLGARRSSGESSTARSGRGSFGNAKVAPASSVADDNELKYQKLLTKLVKQIPCELVVLLPAPDTPISMWAGAVPSNRASSFNRNSSSREEAEPLQEENDEAAAAAELERAEASLARSREYHSQQGSGMPRAKSEGIVAVTASFDDSRLVVPEDFLIDELTPAGFCLETRSLVNIKNLVTDRRFRTRQLDQVSQLCVPLLGKDHDASKPPLGVLKCCNKMEAHHVGKPFDEADVHLVNIFAQMIVDVAEARPAQADGELSEPRRSPMKSTVDRLMRRSSGYASESDDNIGLRPSCGSDGGGSAASGDSSMGRAESSSMSMRPRAGSCDEGAHRVIEKALRRSSRVKEAPLKRTGSSPAILRRDGAPLPAD